MQTQTLPKQLHSRLNHELNAGRSKKRYEGIEWSLSEAPDERVGCFSIDAVVYGPPDTPYKDGIFRIKVSISKDYPFKHPLFRLLTPLYHPSTKLFDPKPASLHLC